MTLKFYFILLLTITLVSRSLYAVHGAEFVCPPAEAIDPCTCSIESNRPGGLYCEGPSVTQEAIVNGVETLRLVNNVSDLALTFLSVSATSLTTIDLTPFLGVSVTFFQIQSNTELTTFTVDSDSSAQIKAFSFAIYDNPLITNEGLGDTLKYLSNEDIGILYVSRCEVTGGHYPLDDESGDVEFLPGLGSLTRVSFLDFTGNKIKEVGGGQFKRNHRIRNLYLDENVGLKFGKDAFLFNPADDADLTWPIYIQLAQNDLTSNDFNETNAISESDRAIQMQLGWNNIDTLPESFFVPFVSTHYLTYVLLPDDPIICDGRLKWYKDNLSEWQHQVQQCRCINDATKYCHESTLIDE